jgi:hypothetical protein
MQGRAVIAPLAVAVVAPVLLTWSCAADVPGPQLCSERDNCPPGSTCVLGRCRSDGTMPVSTEATELRFDPEDLAWIVNGEALGPDTVGDTIVLGRRGQSDALLLLRFAVAIPEDGKLQRAYLVLDPMPQCPRQPGRIRIDVAHVLEPWRAVELGPGRRPRLDTPRRAGEIAATPAQALRLDVTEIVEEWQEHKRRYHGLALSASGESATGACFTSGTAHGNGPRLVVYLWPPEKDAGADGDADADAAADAGDAGRDAAGEAGP